MLNCSILKIFGQIGEILKTLENQYRILINRISEHKVVEFSGLPFRIQEIAKN